MVLTAKYYVSFSMVLCVYAQNHTKTNIKFWRYFFIFRRKRLKIKKHSHDVRMQKCMFAYANIHFLVSDILIIFNVILV